MKQFSNPLQSSEANLAIRTHLDSYLEDVYGEKRFNWVKNETFWHKMFEGFAFFYIEYNA